MNKEFWAGIAVIVSACLLMFVYINSVVTTGAVDYRVFILDTKDVTGIDVGTPVLMAGYNIGQVQDIVVHVEPSLSFEITLSVKPEIQIPIDSTASTGTRLAGGGLINIVPPPTIHGFIEEGSHISLQPAIDVQKLLDTAESILEDISVMTQRGREFVEDPEQGLELRLQEVDVILLEIHGVLESMNGLTKELHKTVQSTTPNINKTLKNTEVLTTESIEAIEAMEQSLLLFDQQLEAMGVLMDGYDPQKNTEIHSALQSMAQTSHSIQLLFRSFEISPLKTMRKGVLVDSEEKASTP
jgi:ABC-type transporter Mla subunit MlaD